MPAYNDYLFLMCSVIAAHLPDPTNVVATAVQCENLNGATSLCLIIEALVCVSWFGWYTCRMHAIYPHTPRLSHFFMFFFFSLNTCFKILQLGCWLLLCFSPSLLSFSSASLSLPCKSWVIYLWHELDVSVRQARRHFISPKVAGYRFHYLLILWFLRELLSGAGTDAAFVPCAKDSNLISCCAPLNYLSNNANWCDVQIPI